MTEQMKIERLAQFSRDDAGLINGIALAPVFIYREFANLARQGLQEFFACIRRIRAFILKAALLGAGHLEERTRNTLRKGVFVQAIDFLCSNGFMCEAVSESRNVTMALHKNARRSMTDATIGVPD
jgi:hypothetical protein